MIPSHIYGVTPLWLVITISRWNIIKCGGIECHQSKSGWDGQTIYTFIIIWFSQRDFLWFCTTTWLREGFSSTSWFTMTTECLLFLSIRFLYHIICKNIWFIVTLNNQKKKFMLIGVLFNCPLPLCFNKFAICVQCGFFQIGMCHSKSGICNAVSFKIQKLLYFSFPTD